MFARSWLLHLSSDLYPRDLLIPLLFCIISSQKAMSAFLLDRQS
jgi:hypothetical protein